MYIHVHVFVIFTNYRNNPLGMGGVLAKWYRELIQDEQTLQEHHTPQVQGRGCMHKMTWFYSGTRTHWDHKNCPVERGILYSEVKVYTKVF